MRMEQCMVLNRGMKLNMPLDKNIPTYQGEWETISARNALTHVWDINFWKKLIDHQARNRYNALTVWVHHPFPALVKVDDYPKACLPGIETFEGYFKDLTHEKRVAYWREVMQYAHDRGMKFYFFNWNIFVDYADQQYPQLTRDINNAATIDYTYKSVKALLATYPELDGFGCHAGDGMPKAAPNEQRTEWIWNAVGKAIKDYLSENPSRKFTHIHRNSGTTPDLWKSTYAPLTALPNATTNFSVKYAMAHMYSTPTPNWNQDIQRIAQIGMKTFLTVRNDDYFYFNWGDPKFVRDFMAGIPSKDAVLGMYIGSDNYSPSRTYFCKNPALNGQLEVERRWYMEMLWGRISYNPNISDDVFKNMLAKRFPSVSPDKLFDAWSLASRSLPRVTELIMKNWNLDIHWYPEGCNGSKWFGPGFRTVFDFANLSTHPKSEKTSVAKGSNLCDIPNSAAGTCDGKKTSYTVADEMQADDNIKQMAYLGLYYAHKVRGATFLSATQTEKAKDEMGKAYCWWMSYTRSMENDYYGDSFRTMAIKPDWKYADADVLKDYTDLGGVGVPECK